MASNSISEADKAKMFDYLKEYQENIKKNFGEYDIMNKKLLKFLSTNDIFIGRMNKKCIEKSKRHQYYMLFEQDKPRNKDNDVAHHLLRHIRNSIAHGRIDKKGNVFFKLEDYSTNGLTKTMIGLLNYKLFFELIDQLQNT